MILRIYLQWKDRVSFFNHYKKAQAIFKQEIGEDLPPVFEQMHREIIEDGQ